MKIKPVALTALVAAVAVILLPTATAYASCSVAAGKFASLTRVVEEELARVAPLRPGSDERDARWLKDNVVVAVPSWMGDTKRFVTSAKPEIDRVVDTCYRPGDHGVPGPVRFEFMACAKKAALTQLAHSHPTEWTAVCDEVRASVDDPETVRKVRTWARDWVDAFIEYRQGLA